MKVKAFYSPKALLLLSLIILCACSGNDDNGNGNPGQQQELDYYIRFDANGSTQEMNIVYNENGPSSTVSGIVNHSGEVNNNQEIYVSIVAGISQISGNDGSMISFHLWTETPIEIGVTYQDEDIMSMTAMYGVSETEAYQESSAFGTKDTDLQLKFTEYSNNELRGTFSGTLFGSSDAEMQITNGEFYVPANYSDF